jgi:eukaryotic-like serine/threonine-protein kinase
MSGMNIGSFEVIGTLGTGANSSILHVRRAEDSKAYALKVVPINGPEDQKFLDQAEHEFAVAQKFDHPNLVKIYALEKVKNWFFTVTKLHMLVEYVNGKTLDTCPRLTIPRLVQVFKMVADGLVHMHRRQVCHGDLKPNNIMLSRAGEVKIIDYGLARIKGEVVARTQGTPEYMAPETVKHQMVNERTDIYNFGGAMYRLLTWKLPPPVVSEEDGNLPLSAKMWARVFKKVEEVNPRVPAPLAALVNQCLQFDAKKRPERVSEIQGALDRLCDDLVKGPEDSLEAIDW